MNTQQSAPVIPGVVLDQVIGRGATSVVWSGVRVETGLPIAVKVTAPDRLHVGQLMELAARETAILAKVDHPHIVRLHEAHPLPDGSVAVLLDLAVGGSLTELIAARGRLEPGEVSTICTPIAEALAALHAAGVVHGDLAPGNILFTADGRPLLSDFEAARLVGESHPPQVSGTRGFVAPEVVGGDVPSEASDVFGVGALAWFALTGRSWAGGPVSGLARGGAPTLAEGLHLLGPGFGSAVAAMLADAPTDRPSAHEAAILAYHASTPIPVRLGSREALTADPDVVLTQRLRERGGVGELSVQARTASQTVTERQRRTAWRGDGIRLAWGRRAKVAAAGALSLLAVGLLAGVVVRLTPAAAAESAQPTGQATAQPTVQPTVQPTMVTGPTRAAANAAASATADGRSTPDPVSSAAPEISRVFVDLVNARARALMDRSTAALVAADAPGSKQRATDVSIIQALLSADERYVGLSFTVATVEGVSLDGATAVVRAVVGRSAYRVIGPGGHDQHVPADPGAVLVYSLVQVDGAWRLADVSR